MRISGISRNVDSCEGLIALNARKTYARIRSNDKRWLDLDDFIQEGVILAWQAEGTYLPERLDKSKPHSKYSTWLTWLLTRKFNSFAGRFDQGKRRTGPLMELDAPIGVDGDSTYGESLQAVPDTTVEELQAVEAFMMLLGAVSAVAAEVLIRGLLFTDTVRAVDMGVCREIGDTAAGLGITRVDLARVGRSENIRKKVLTGIVKDGMISEGAEADLKVLQCAECGRKFSLRAVREQRFFVESMTCGSCYRGMKSAPVEVSCFGKSKTQESEGYSEQDEECTLHCRDRVACKKFKEHTMPEVETETGVDDVDFSEVEEKAAAEEKPAKKAKKAAAPVAEEKPAKKKAKPVPAAEEEPEKKGKKAAAEKPAKEAKPAKEKKEKAAKKEDDRGAPPKDVVVWPFRNGSVLDYMFRAAYEGCKEKTLQKEIEEAGSNYKNCYKIGIGKLSCPTHTWKLTNENGQIKLFGVKYLGKVT